MRPGETRPTGLLGGYLPAAKHTKDSFRRERRKFRRTVKTRPTGPGPGGPAAKRGPSAVSVCMAMPACWPRSPGLHGIRGHVQGQVVRKYQACLTQGKKEDRSHKDGNRPVGLGGRVGAPSSRRGMWGATVWPLTCRARTCGMIRGRTLCTHHIPARPFLATLDLEQSFMSELQISPLGRRGNDPRLA